jgi:hypothetical protein
LKYLILPSVPKIPPIVKVGVPMINPFISNPPGKTYSVLAGDIAFAPCGLPTIVGASIV